MKNKLILETKVSNKTGQRYFMLKVCDTYTVKVLTFDLSLMCFILDCSESTFYKRFGELGVYDIGFIQRDL